MTALKTTANCLAVLLVLQTLLLGAAHSQEAGNSSLKEEISKQEAIYQSKENQLLENYVINRALADYSKALPAEFARSLANLGPQDRWLDVGAGEGQAILDYYTSKYDEINAEGRQGPASKASAVAISIEDRRTPRWHQTDASLGIKKIQYLFGRSLREYSRQELGRFQAITDVIGGFSYTANLDQYMEKALDVLVVGGSFYSLLQDVHSEDGRNSPYYAGSPYLTELKKADGSEIKVCTWLRSIACVQVACELRMSWKPPVEVYHVHKVCNDVKVPALTPVHYEAGTPPERRFQLKNPSQIPAHIER